MYVDENGKVHEGTEGGTFNPWGEDGHRLSNDDGGTVRERLERVAENVAAAERGELSLTVPTAVKVAAGVVAVGLVAMPLGAMVLSFLAARKAARAAAAAAPYVAEAGPVIMAAVPEAAPVVAAAGVINAVGKARAGQPIPAGTPDHVAQLVGALRTIPSASPTQPSATVPGAPASGQPSRVQADAPSGAATEHAPNQSYAGQLLGALRTIASQPASLRVEVDGVPVRAELMKSREHG
jgi:hypothetical protein